jgi:hypothetical protein
MQLPNNSGTDVQRARGQGVGIQAILGQVLQGFCAVSGRRNVTGSANTCGKASVCATAVLTTVALSNAVVVVC